MYGRDVAENFICMITFCDGGDPLVVGALGFPGNPNHRNEKGELEPLQKSIFCDLIPLIKDPWYLQFNSSALFSRNNTSNLAMIKTFWDIGMSSFEVFMRQKILLLPRKSLV